MVIPRCFYRLYLFNETFLFAPRVTRCVWADRAWTEPLLAVVTTVSEGGHTLRLFSLEGVFVGRDDRCVCSVMLETEMEEGGEGEVVHQASGI